MVPWLTVEQRIIMEYSAIRAWVALNPYWAICIASVLGWAIGKII